MPPPPPPGSSNGHNGSLNAESEEFVPPMTDNDLSAIRSRYLGVDKKKRKIRKMNDRKFVFDWDEQDDTFSAEAPAAVGSQRQGAQIMFGRGHIAGMDDGGGSAAPRRNGAEGGLQLADALERRKAAKSGLDERHWTEKSLDEMKERDWRIFREDFSIASRGKYCHLWKLYAFPGKSCLFLKLAHLQPEWLGLDDRCSIYSCRSHRCAAYASTHAWSCT